MRAIFLDFDGVLHDVDAGSIEYEGGYMIVTGERLFEHMPLLERIVLSYPDVILAIHSSWRNHFTLAEMREKFSPALRDRVHGVTLPGSQRYAGILDYVEAHGVSDYIILDDMPGEFCYDGPPPDELIICHEKHGISTPAVLEQIQAWLDLSR